MRYAAAIFFALSLCLGASSHAVTITPVPDEPTSAPLIAADDSFFATHPDLKSEPEVVAEAARLLRGEDFQPRDQWEAAEALAAKSHRILAERTPEEWQRKAVSLYPALGVAGSEFNTLFLQHYHELQTSSPLFVDEPSWPLLLAKRCDEELQAKAAKTASGNASTTKRPATAGPNPAAASASPQKPAAPTSPHRSGHPWQTAFSVIMLFFAVLGPSIYVFWKIDLKLRARSQTPLPSKTNAALWRSALKHAAFFYAIVALSAAIHNLMVNADLGFADRFVVSLLVGTLFGLFVTVPFYAIDALWQSLHRRLIGPVGH